MRVASSWRRFGRRPFCCSVAEMDTRVGFVPFVKSPSNDNFNAPLSPDFSGIKFVAVLAPSYSRNTQFPAT